MARKPRREPFGGLTKIKCPYCGGWLYRDEGHPPRNLRFDWWSSVEVQDRFCCGRERGRTGCGAIFYANKVSDNCIMLFGSLRRDDLATYERQLKKGKVEYLAGMSNILFGRKVQVPVHIYVWKDQENTIIQGVSDEKLWLYKARIVLTFQWAHFTRSQIRERTGISERRQRKLVARFKEDPSKYQPTLDPMLAIELMTQDPVGRRYLKDRLAVALGTPPNRLS